MGSLAEVTGLESCAPHPRTKYVLEIYLRSTYAYNASALEDIKELEEIDRETCRRLFRAMLKSKDPCITKKAARRLEAQTRITPTQITPPEV